MKRIQPITGITVIFAVAAGVLLMTAAGCDHHRYSVYARGGNYCGPSVRYTEYRYVEPVRTTVYTSPRVVVLGDRDHHDRDRDHRDRRDRDGHRPHRR